MDHADRRVKIFEEANSIWAPPIARQPLATAWAVGARLSPQRTWFHASIDVQAGPFKGAPARVCASVLLPVRWQHISTSSREVTIDNRHATAGPCGWNAFLIHFAAMRSKKADPPLRSCPQPDRNRRQIHRGR
jgi:hypothetical protein